MSCGPIPYALVGIHGMRKIEVSAVPAVYSARSGRVHNVVLDAAGDSNTCRAVADDWRDLVTE
jgi:hypothetical protein